MTTNARFPALTVDDAPAAIRSTLAQSEKQFGFLASPLARAAHSPALLKHVLAGFGAFERSSLSPTEREVVAMTVARSIGCHYCMALHSALLSRTPGNEALLAALRAGTPLHDARLESIRAFVLEVIDRRGRVDEERYAALERAGMSREAILEVVLGVGVYVLSTLMNIVTDAPLDPAFAAFRWQPSA